jgi:hypothetical protein
MGRPAAHRGKNAKEPLALSALKVAKLTQRMVGGYCWVRLSVLNCRGAAGTPRPAPAGGLGPVSSHDWQALPLKIGNRLVACTVVAGKHRVDRQERLTHRDTAAPIAIFKLREARDFTESATSEIGGSSNSGSGVGRALIACAESVA